MSEHYDAIIVGSGPNGLAAAITLARAGCSVLVCEANSTIGGGARSTELTLPGFVHDVCSAVHPLAAGSPFFRTLPLERFGLEWIQPQIPLAHPLDNGSAARLYKDVDSTADSLGIDASAYRRLMKPLAHRWQALANEFLQPMLHFPQHPITLARFGIPAICPATVLAKFLFRHEPARALFAGIAAHSFLPLEALVSSAFALVLGLAGHAVGWPIPRGGSQQIANALANYLRELGGSGDFGAAAQITSCPSGHFGLGIFANHRSTIAGGISPATAVVSTRTRHFQNRLRAERTNSVDRKSVPSGGHDSCWRRH
jgi:phytoene dehydrogenase-like protein